MSTTSTASHVRSAPVEPQPPTFPVSAKVQSVLMDDAIRGDQVKLGGADQSVALFINPATNDVEARAVYGAGQLGWLRRTGGLTGWKLLLLMTTPACPLSPNASS
jgi:hypothetical protein